MPPEAPPDTFVLRLPDGSPLIDADIDLYVERYHFVLGDEEGLVVLHFASPSLAVVDALPELVEAIASTIELVHA